MQQTFLMMAGTEARPTKARPTNRFVPSEKANGVIPLPQLMPSPWAEGDGSRIFSAFDGSAWQ